MTQYGNTLVHPALTRSLYRHFPNRANIQDRIETADDFNQPVFNYVDNPLLVAIPCYIEPASGGEARQPGNTLVTNQWNIILAGDYPQIQKTQRIVVDDQAYDIDNVSVEATHTITAIVAKIVSI